MKGILELRLMLILLYLPIYLTGCSETVNNTGTDYSVEFILPQSIDISPNGCYTFDVQNNHAPMVDAELLLEASIGVFYNCPIIESSLSHFTVKINESLKSGSYRVYYKQEDHKKYIGSTIVNIVDDIVFTPNPTTTIYGLISANGEPVENVVVSDGYEMTTTDSNGIYQLNSGKQSGYVFISLPSGYEAMTDGVLPVIHHKTLAEANQIERADFKLSKIDNPDEYTLLVLGDIHLANRNKDLLQFKKFTDELQNLLNANNGKAVYAITLGDMSWDIYWDDNKFGLPDYLNTMNRSLNGIQIFHTMGNHDNDFTATSDFTAELPYRNLVAPTYYSFNLGKVHYVVLDDIDCSEYDGTTARKYAERVTDNQLDWLAKDLSYVDISTPVVIAMHAPMFKPVRNTTTFTNDIDKTNYQRLMNILDGYTVHFISGHTHNSFNALQGKIHEHNSGAVCGTWWWTGSLTDGIHISPDGTPGGYAVWNIRDKDISYRYKAIGHPDSYQFRAYDLNEVHFSLDDVPNMPRDVDTKVMNKFLEYVNAYPANSNNEILLNIWNWNPKWSITVATDKGDNLKVIPVWACDPLHIAAMTIKRFNSSSLKSIPNFITEEYTHFFKTTAPDANSTLNITVRDEFGNTWSEKMERPKKFIISDFKQSN